MRLRGTVGKKVLCVLIDSGSIHNFLDVKMANKLGCVVKEIDELIVVAANGNELKCKENCHKFVWTMQGQTFETYVMALP